MFLSQGNEYKINNNSFFKHIQINRNKIEKQFLFCTSKKNVTETMTVNSAQYIGT